MAAFTSPCGKCLKKIKTDSIVCDGCQTGFHPGCAGAPKKLFEDLSTMRKVGFRWFCIGCVGANTPLGLTSKCTDFSDEQDAEILLPSFLDKVNDLVNKKTVFLNYEKYYLSCSSHSETITPVTM